MISQKLLNKLLFFFIIIISFLSCFIFFAIPKNIENEEINYVEKQLPKEEELKPITGKNLSLLPLKIDLALPAIKEQLEVYSIEPRFDFSIKKIKFDLKFKNLNKIKKINEEDKLYLILKTDGTYDFSDEKTSIYIKLKQVDNKNVKVFLEADLSDLNINEIKENISDSFIHPINDLSLNSNLEDKYEFKVLMSSKWWGIDLLLNIQNKNKDQKERLEIDGDILELDDKDTLIFKDGKWSLKTSTDNSSNYPIGRIININSQTIEFEAWDISGENKYRFSISPNPKVPFSAKLDQLISSVKKRTNTHVSLMIDKQRLILKERDMLIKKDNRWKLLKKDAFLNEIKNEEIFYFEKIEERNSKKILIGYFFNSMRTDFQKVEIPIISFANQKRIKKR